MMGDTAAMDAMHDAMRHQMPEELRVACDAAHETMVSSGGAAGMHAAHHAQVLHDAVAMPFGVEPDGAQGRAGQGNAAAVGRRTAHRRREGSGRGPAGEAAEPPAGLTALL